MPMRVPFPRNLVMMGSVLTVGGCAVTTPPPRFTAVSPADPAAPEGAVPPPDALLTGEGELAEKDATVYTCPRHPEVTAKEPGRCPSCGMALVKKDAAPKEHP